ncbi:MAG: molybdenum cofactor guanylyltransferase [Flavobacteriales bacterium]|nr:molybdenum cofactor guanylyltransferase [Flavobacteriales bacterium]
MKNNDVVAVVMAGGRSKRMGVDKGLIEYKSKAQRYYLADLLKTIIDEVVISVPFDFSVPSNPNYRYVKDLIADFGPLGGLYSIFKAFPEKSILLVATDMPEVDVEDITRLLDNRDKSKYITCYKNSEDFVEPLFAIWENKSFPLIDELVKEKKLSMRMIIRKYPSKIINAADDRSLLNINTEKERKDYLG